MFSRERSQFGRLRNKCLSRKSEAHIVKSTRHVYPFCPYLINLALLLKSGMYETTRETAFCTQDRMQKEYLEEHKVPLLVEYARLEAEQKVCWGTVNCFHHTI